MAGFLFHDIFSVENLNPNGEGFDKVTRIVAQGEKHDVLMHLDVNTEIYPMSKGDKFLMVLTPTLNCNGYPGSDNKPQAKQKSLADKFEYIMHGLLYKISDEGSGSHLKVGVYASFGGLQMMLRGQPSFCTKFKVSDARVLTGKMVYWAPGLALFCKLSFVRLHDSLQRYADPHSNI